MTDAQRTEYQNGIAAFYRIYITDRENLKLPENAGEWFGYGWQAAEQSSAHLPDRTPEWIVQFIGSTPHGGWIHPIHLTAEHPLVKESWGCQHCFQPFRPGDVGIIMPFHSSAGGRWIAYHRHCSSDLLGLSEKAETR